MKFTSSFVVVSFLMLLSLLCEAQQQVSLLPIPKPLEWIAQPLEYKNSNDSLLIRAGKGTDLYTSVDGSKSVHNVPILVFQPDSNFIFTAKVQPVFSKAYDGGSLIVYNDEKNWAKLLLEQNVDGSIGIWTTVATHNNGDDNYNARIDGKEIYLKIAKTGSAYCFYYSMDGSRWNVIRAFPMLVHDKVKVGFSAQSPLGEECQVLFSEITYRPKGFSDFYTGE